MPRQARQASGTGIYHVMMRGINHQNIFEEQEDYYQFLNTLDMMALSYEPDGTPSGRNYILYAYCLMSNHFHLLIRELPTLGEIQSVASDKISHSRVC
jgi:REP element-mobilizing transposase RayT